MQKIPLDKIFEDALKSEKLVKVKDVAETFQQTIAILYNKGSVLKRIENKIGEEDFNILITSLSATFLTTIYANAELINKEKVCIRTYEELVVVTGKYHADKIYDLCDRLVKENKDE